MSLSLVVVVIAVGANAADPWVKSIWFSNLLSILFISDLGNRCAHPFALFSFVISFCYLLYIVLCWQLAFGPFIIVAVVVCWWYVIVLDLILCCRNMYGWSASSKRATVCNGGTFHEMTKLNAKHCTSFLLSFVFSLSFLFFFLFFCSFVYFALNWRAFILSSLLFSIPHSEKCYFSCSSVIMRRITFTPRK